MFSLSSNPGFHLCDPCISSLCAQCRSTLLLRSSDLNKEPTPNRTGSSSHSIESNDSAFCDQRLLDLNEGLSNPNSLSDTLLYVCFIVFLTLFDLLSLSHRTLKCELASLLNKENTYQMIIKEKSDAIRKIEKQLADVIQSQSTSNK